MISEIILSRFNHFISNEMGIYFQKDALRELEKKMNPLAKVFGFDHLKPCMEWLMNGSLSREQIDIIAQALTVGETYFFRDEHFFNALRKKILPDMIQEHVSKGRKTKIWCTACCTGEEPYSIAILLDSIFPNALELGVSIIATDINPQFLHKAERAVYGEWSFRSTPLTIKQKYFKKIDNSKYELLPKIRRMVTFSSLNLAHDLSSSLENQLDQIDLIVCNNVLIYFSPDQIFKITRQISTVLAEDGWLAVSPIEVPYIVDSQLKAHHFFHSTFFRKTNSVRVEVPEKKTTYFPPLLAKKVIIPPQATILEPPPIPQHKKIDPDEGVYKDCCLLYEKGKYADVIAKLKKKCKGELDEEYLGTHIKEISLLIRAYANQGDLNQARLCCEQVLAIEKIEPDLYVLYATILQELGLMEEAILALKNALFLNPDLVVANFALANAFLKASNKNEAKRFYRNTLKLLEKYDPRVIILETEGMTAGGLIEYIKKQKISYGG